MSDQDIREQMQKSSSAKRYRPMNNPVQAQVATLDETRRPIQQRASRTAEQPLVRRTAEYPEPTTRAPRSVPLQEELLRRTTQTYQQRPLPDTDADVEVAPHVRMRSDRPAPPTRHLPPLRQKTHRQQLHWLVIVGIAMLSFLVVILLAVQVLVGWTNGVHDPGYYTQTAHLDMVVAATDAQGHQSQVRAFLDAQNHLDLLIVPMSGDASKAHVVVGPNPITVTDLQHATITVTARSTVVSVLVQGPLEANLNLSTTRQSSLRQR